MYRKIILWLIIACIVIFVGYLVLPKFLFPSGVWQRSEDRQNPLQHPIQVVKVGLDEIELSNGLRCKFTGVIFPRDSMLIEKALEFLQVITLQGVEIIRRVNDSDKYILRCEPRIWHWCGNDPVSAHFEQYNLNELVIMSGYAQIDSSAQGLTDEEINRLRKCESFAKDNKWGIWKESKSGHDFGFNIKWGLNISDAIRLNYLDIGKKD